MHFRIYALIGLLAFLALISLSQAKLVGLGHAVAQQPVKPASPQTPAKPVEEEPVPLTAPVKRDELTTLPTLGPDQFGSFFMPQINNRGDVAFLGRYTAPKSPAGYGQAIFIKQAAGGWKFIRDTDPAANVKESGFIFGPFSFNDQSQVAVTAAFGRKPALHAQTDTAAAPSASERNSGIFTTGPQGFVNLVSLGQDVPNMPSRFSSFSNPSVNSQGTVAFVAAYVDPDGRGLFVSEGGKLRIVVRSGQRIVAGQPTVFSEHYYPGPINERGEVAFLSRIGVGAGIFVLRSTGIEMLAADGKPSPVAGTKYLGFGNRTPAINDKGEVVYSGFYDGPNAGRALFYKGVTGPTRLLITSSNKTQKYKFTDVMNPEINNRGDIAFIGRLEGRTYGVFLKTAKGVEQIALTGELPVGLKPGEEFNNFAHQPSINDNGDIVFYAQLKNSSVGVFIKDAKGLRPLVVRGDKLPF